MREYICFYLESSPVTSVPWGAIGGGLGAAILVIVIVILIVVVLKRQSCFEKKSQPTLNTPMVVIEGSPEQKTPVYLSRSCKLADFAERWKEMNVNAHLMFATEIEELDPVGRELSTTVAEMSVNNFKNRHSNILPYD
ncbi:hypothetical protein LSAT2_000535 [Lamellibrachia satsuma]|nr:hypothetical protein LSAT2_000535 [Lamellibrachia satsuma]